MRFYLVLFDADNCEWTVYLPRCELNHGKGGNKRGKPLFMLLTSVQNGGQTSKAWLAQKASLADTSFLTMSGVLLTGATLLSPSVVLPTSYIMNLKYVIDCLHTVVGPFNALYTVVTVGGGAHCRKYVCR